MNKFWVGFCMFPVVVVILALVYGTVMELIDPTPKEEKRRYE